MSLKELRAREAAALKAYREWQLTQPCKDHQPLCRFDGGCLRHDTDCGEACPRNDPGSSSGRTTAFEAVNLGSSPRPGTNSEAKG